MVIMEWKMHWKMGSGRKGVGDPIAFTNDDNVSLENEHRYVNKQRREERCTRRRKEKTSRGNYFLKPTLLCHTGIIFLLYLISQCEALEPPKILDQETGTVFVNKGDDLQLECQGEAPLKWFHMEPNVILENDTEKVTVTNWKEESGSSPFKSKLEIKDVSYKEGGYIFCDYSESESDSSLEHAGVIVSVVGQGHLIVKNVETDMFRPLGYPVTIPCRPVDPHIKIEITHESNPNHPIQLDENNYNVSSGYEISALTDQQHGKFTCKAKFKEFTDILHIIVNTIPSFEHFGKSFGKIYLNITNGGTITAGEDFEVVCYTTQSFPFLLNITGPNSPENQIRGKISTGTANQYLGKPSLGERNWLKRYHVSGARKEDSGNYSCTVTPAQPTNSRSKSVVKQIRVFDEGEDFIDVATELENITVREFRTAQWVVNLTTYPTNYKYVWRNENKNEDIPHLSNKFSISKSSKKDDEFVLKISNVSIEDTGNYPFIVSIPRSDVEPKILNLHLAVTAKPKVKIDTNGPKSSFLVNESYELYCNIMGFPLPEVYWTYESCDTVSNCKPPINVTETSRRKNKFGFTSIIEMNATEHGKYSCFASSSLGKSFDTKRIRVVDFNGDSELFIEMPEEVVEGDDVEITCALSKFNNTDGKLIWMREINGNWQRIGEELTVKSQTDWSWRNVLNMKNIEHSASGRYMCKDDKIDADETIVTINVLDVSPPQLILTNLNQSKATVKLGDTLNLTCHADGKPKPTITWTWEDHPKEEWPQDLKYSLFSDATTLYLKYIPEEAVGRFKCIAANRNGTTEAFLDVAVTGTRKFSDLAVGIIIVLFFALVIFGIFLARYKYKQDELSRRLRKKCLKEFYEGGIDNINPDLSVTDQAYLLPFDVQWEFPKDRLKLGIQLGSGAFGRVVKADACGILDSEPITTVAVKMVKPNADESHLKALMSELKIMVHLGKHINVVNLLGACTKGLSKNRELFVIVEYCKYGSLLSYMHRHRKTFINQLDPARGSIDPTIDRCPDRNSEQSQMARKPASNGYRTLEEFNGPTAVDDPPTPTLHPVMQGNGHPVNPDFLMPNNRRSTEHYVPESQVESACTGISYLSNGPGTTDGTKRRSSVGSQWQDHYRGDYQARDVRPIKTTDLLCWAFQISRGMEYLASRKVLHGDLAARNVLLAENNIVKICDFGLAKEMYKDYKYKKKSEGVLLPVKWMAIESIYYGLFSTQSDSWSFGVVLWELFTLGKTPYPGMEADEKFYKRISEGYRMEKPPLAPSCVYDMMLECWAQEPTERPTFSALADRIGDMMEESLRNHYVDLNTAYMKINQASMSGRTDYLLQMGRTEFASNSNRPTPERDYQNLPKEGEESAYLEPIRPSTSTNEGPPGVELKTIQTKAPNAKIPDQSSHTYQNIQHGPQESSTEPTCTMLANNTGYMFIKSSLPLPLEGESPGMNQEQDAKYTLEIRYSPDVKDLYFPDEIDESTLPIDSNHVQISIDENGHKGVDNRNYVSNNIPFKHKFPINGHSKLSPSVPNGDVSGMKNGYPDTEDFKSGEIQSRSNSKRKGRQKNDSGVGLSIDSAQFAGGNGNNNNGSHLNSPNQHCVDFSNHLQSNGYVSHNISSFS